MRIALAATASRPGSNHKEEAGRSAEQRSTAGTSAALVHPLGVSS